MEELLDETIKKAVEEIKPDPAVLRNILASPVTKALEPRYTQQEGRSFFAVISTFFKQPRNSISLAVIAIAVIALSIGRAHFETNTAPVTNPVIAQSIDQILLPIKSGADQTDSISNQESAFDQQVLLADTQSTGGLDQPFDEGVNQ